MGATQSKSSSYVLETSKGKLKGIEQTDLNGKPILRRFLKIPYALPPVGHLRFRRPQPVSSDFSFSAGSGEAGDYTSFGPTCPQPVYNHGAALIENASNAPEIENTQSEDCLYLNIWTPVGDKPAKGWPVQFFIHGGWLQIGDANQTNNYDPFDLLASSTPRIIVAPTYRLNILGFLAGKELSEAEGGDPAAGNYGLWDQRAALEWVHGNIALFGGNPELITVGGLSAGAHSAFLQLYHDTYLPEGKQLIKQVFQWSNAIAIQPNASDSQILTNQYDELCSTTGVSNAKDKLSALRQLPAQHLVAAISKLKMHTFRTSTDNDFVPANFLETIHNGSFTALLAQHKVRILLGEVSDEAELYKLVNPPTTQEGLVRQLGNYYPKPVVDKLLTLNEIYDIPSSSDDASSNDTKERYKDTFAQMVADLQVHASIRGLTKALVAPTDGSKDVPEVLRYRIAWRAKALDSHLKPEVGVCHAADAPIWWLSGYRAGFDEKDKAIVAEFLKPFGEFLEGKIWVGGVGKGEDGAKRIGRVLDRQGKTHEDVEDELWEKCMKVWSAAADAQGIK